MSIVSSVFVLDAAAQIDGRIYCTEQHTDHLGAVHVFNYLSESNADNAAIASSRAIRLAEELAEAEAGAIIYGT